MSGGFPCGFEVCNLSDQGTDLVNIRGTVLTPNASANTKGSYAQLVASSPSDCVMIDVAGRSLSTGSVGTYSIDIAVGAGGSEVVIIPDLMLHVNNSSSVGIRYLIPIQIPAGTRISARCQTSLTGTGATGLAVSVILMDAAFPHMEGAGGVDAIGFIPSTTRGTSFTVGAINAKGSYSQVVASTAVDYMGLIPILLNPSGAGESSILADIAVGAGGSEQIIVPNLFFRDDTLGIMSPSIVPFIPIQIPASTRLAVRGQNSTGGDVFDMVLYGVYH